MVLEQSRDGVLSWFEGRKYDDIRVMVEVLDTKGYNVEEFDTPGEAGAVRRIVALVKENGENAEGHAVVMDDDHYVVDPRSKSTTKKTLLDYVHSGYTPERVFIITKKV
jgi:hypothetical protein